MAGEPEVALVTGFCDRVVALGLPLARAQVLIDTLHPIHEGRLFRWSHDSDEPVLLDYGRTGPVGAPGAAASDPQQAEASERWRQSPFYRMLLTGESLLRRRLSTDTETEFSVLPDMRAVGTTDYVAIINRFAADGAIGEMDCVYSSWTTKEPRGFDDDHIAALQRIVPFLALAIKSASLALGVRHVALNCAIVAANSALRMFARLAHYWLHPKPRVCRIFLGGLSRHA